MGRGGSQGREGKGGWFNYVIGRERGKGGREIFGQGGREGRVSGGE